ncbi:exodeoxyribonuclease VII small subunit, partial [Acinetobacter baumannii]|uniref:exodeoxyribonuclease VII small subunit n=1 Tax=Acinetobacter baumannii TaxID=470 RepID=UPI003AF9F458
MNDKELTFKECHDILKRIAELLESQESTDIDNLMKIFEESIGAYKACKARIEA